jgi:hypothetical protein
MPLMQSGRQGGYSLRALARRSNPPIRLVRRRYSRFIRTEIVEKTLPPDHLKLIAETGSKLVWPVVGPRVAAMVKYVCPFSLPAAAIGLSLTSRNRDRSNRRSKE